MSIFLESDKATYMITGNELKVGSNKVIVAVTAENGNVRTYTITVTRREIVSALLENISEASYDLTEEFDSNLTIYNMLVNYETTSLNLSITTLDKKATYEVNGNSNFEIGTNVVTITVTASDKVTRETYIIYVKRQAYGNNFLEYLYTSVGELTPVYSRYTMRYSIEVPNEVEELELIGELSDASARVTGLGNYEIESGTTDIPVVITTTKGIRRTYHVTVHKEKSGLNNLEDLTVKYAGEKLEYQPTFNTETHTYSMTVDSTVLSVTIDGKVSPHATVTGFGKRNLTTGLNTVPIKVTAENGDENDYTLNITKVPSDNAELIELVPSAGVLDPEFSYGETNYELSLTSSTAVLSFTASTEMAGTTISGLGSQVVPDGISTRVITVTAEDGKTTKSYTVTINKTITDNALLSSLSFKGYNLNETFSPNNFIYTINVPNSVSSVTKDNFTWTTQDPNAKVTTSGTTNLSTKSQTQFTITVTAADGFTRQSYKVGFIRAYGSKSRILNIVPKLGYLQQVFERDTLEYDWVVSRRTQSVNLSQLAITLEDPNATISANTPVQVLGHNLQHMDVKCTSEDRTTSTTYRLNIVFVLTSIAHLETLTFDHGKILEEYDPEITDYDVHEYKSVTDDVIHYTFPEDEEGNFIESGVPDVHFNEDGSDTVHEIVAISEGGNDNTYVLTFIRDIEEETRLQSISFNGIDSNLCTAGKCYFNPSFNPDVENYKYVTPYAYETLDLTSIVYNNQQYVKYFVNGVEYQNATYTLEPGAKTNVEVRVFDGLRNHVKTYNIEVTRSASPNAYLKSLKVLDKDGKEYYMSPEFKPRSMEYTIEVESDVMDVEIVAQTEEAKAGWRANNYNLASIDVWAPDGTRNTYYIHILKIPEQNSYIKSITVSTGTIWDLSPSYRQTTFSYTTTVTDGSDVVRIDAIPSTSTTSIVGGIGHQEFTLGTDVELHTGYNEYTLTAISKDGEASIYKLGVIKEVNRNVNLGTLVVDEADLTPEFSKDIINYDLEVESDVTELTIAAVPEDSKSSVKITGNKNFHTGLNTVNVIVLSADKSASKTYTLNVMKKLDENTKLTSINIKDLVTEGNPVETITPEDGDDRTYLVNVPASVNTVDIDVIPESSLTTVTSLGNHFLSYEDNIFRLVAIAESGDTETYTVNVYRNYDLTLDSLTVTDMEKTVDAEIEINYTNDVDEYNVNVSSDVRIINIEAIKHASNVRVTGDGEIILSTGLNELEVIVTPPDGKNRVIKLNITRAQSTNNYIEDLYVEEGRLTTEFNKEVNTHQVYVRYGTQSVTLHITMEDNRATYNVLNNNSFRTGRNITPKLENKEFTTYMSGYKKEITILINLRV